MRLICIVPALLLVLAARTRMEGATYYVDTQNSGASDSNPGTATSPWKTISKANQVLIPGDTVFIKAGVYNSYIVPSRSGTASSPIKYQNFGTDVVTVSNASQGITLTGKSYIIVQGIRFTMLDTFMWLDGANHNTIAYCTFDKMRNYAQWGGSKIYNSSSYNWVHDCRFSQWGYYTSDDLGSLLDIGNENTQTDVSNYNLFENNVLFAGGHHVLGVFGMYNVIRNNYLHNENWSNDHGNRVVYLNGYPTNSGFNLIDSNRIAYSGIPPDNWGASGMSMATRYNIVRRNSFYHNNAAGVSMSTTDTYPNSPSYNRVYNNTFLHNGFNTNSGADSRMQGGVALARFSGTTLTRPVVQNAFKNNLFRFNSSSFSIYANTSAEIQAMRSDQAYSANWEEAGDPLMVNASSALGNPFDSTWPDLSLRTNSPCIDRGTSLTTITSASGSGTTFQVLDAGYFMAGWGIVTGDDIQLLGSQQRARITNVNYQTGKLTLDQIVTWTQSQGVTLAYGGAGPDLGAFENPGLRPLPPTNLRVVGGSGP